MDVDCITALSPSSLQSLFIVVCHPLLFAICHWPSPLVTIHHRSVNVIICQFRPTSVRFRPMFVIRFCPFDPFVHQHPFTNVHSSPFIPINVPYFSNLMYCVHMHPILYFSNCMYVFFKIIYRFVKINTYIYILSY